MRFSLSLSLASSRPPTSPLAKSTLHTFLRKSAARTRRLLKRCSHGLPLPLPLVLGVLRGLVWLQKRCSHGLPTPLPLLVLTRLVCSHVSGKYVRTASGILFLSTLSSTSCPLPLPSPSAVSVLQCVGLGS
jgi:hypothetical protein